ncbi:YjeF N-terminal domain-like protein [Piromyces finnis]|uniref:Enhancer of mRNA-decapping protein 3 n=1 Tax=Piromyces finnis TaxID=1754191 RepID=A0A1Y1VFQ9_9FUNG|nr:YjeF N-terminal domain-like protein [Piromyces finnis]|eukprot:ORX55256.1 YjeF N-terminal domain-like protein [Piromyces finnis]
MANEFLGLSVEVQLSNGLIVNGVVADINQKSQQLILHNATLNINNIKQFSKVYIIQSTDIKDLQLTSDKKVNNVNTSNLSSPTSNYPNVQTAPPPVQPQPQLSSSSLISPQILPMYGSSTNLNPNVIPINNMLPLGGIPANPNGGNLNNALFNKSNSSTEINKNNTQNKSFLDDDEEDETLHSPTTKQNNVPYIDPAIVSYSQQISDNNSDVTSNSTQKILSTTLNNYSSKKNNSKINENNNDEDDLVDYEYSRNSQRKYKKKNQKSYFNSLKEQRTSIQSNYSSKGNSKYNTSPGRQRKGRRNETNQWANGDVNLYKDEEFDFQGNLGLFDKKKEWAKIRETNNIAPETLLVNLNRIKKENPSPYRHRHHHSSGGNSTDGHPYYESSQVKLGIHENVLDSVASDSDSEYESSNEDETSQNNVPGIGKTSRVIFENSAGVPIPSLTESQASLLEHLTTNEYGIKEEITIENAGRDVAMMVIQALGGNRRINIHNHNSAPFVVILAGNNKSGAYAINAAKHLLNHECRVLVCMASEDDDTISMVAYQKKIFYSLGGKCIYQASNLPTKAVDIIVDGILGASQYLDKILEENQRECIKGMMEWANGIKTPVVSIECPSGIHPYTGEIINSNHYIKTKWTLALGLPRLGLTNNDLTGGILLGDIGIAKSIYKTLGLKPSYRHPFADKYLTSIELIQ